MHISIEKLEGLILFKKKKIGNLQFTYILDAILAALGRVSLNLIIGMFRDSWISYELEAKERNPFRKDTDIGDTR